MRSWAGLAVLGLLVAALPACRRPGTILAAPTDPDGRVVLAFLEAYGRRDLEGMMRLLEEDAVFRGSSGTLSKAQIRAFFQDTFRKHPGLRVEAGEVQSVQGRLQVRVRVHTDAAWSDVWIFEMRNHRIRAYGLASGQR